MTDPLVNNQAIKQRSFLSATESSNFFPVAALQLAYRPKTPGELDYKFNLSTHANPFENVEIHVKGCAFSEELIWSVANSANQSILRTGDGELLDGNHLMFDDVPLGKMVIQDLSLRNISTQAISFDLNMDSLGQLKDRLIITPSGGTLAPSAACLVNVSFKTDEPISVTHHPINFTTLFLQGAENSANSSRVPSKNKGRAKNKQTDGKSDGTATGRGDAPSPEELILHISVSSDVRQCEVNIERIDFDATTLFKSRLFSFTLVSSRMCLGKLFTRKPSSRMPASIPAQSWRIDLMCRCCRPISLQYPYRMKCSSRKQASATILVFTKWLLAVAIFPVEDSRYGVHFTLQNVCIWENTGIMSASADTLGTSLAR